MDVRFKLVIPLEGALRGDEYMRYRDSILSGAKADFLLRAKSDKIYRYSKQRSYDLRHKPGVYQLSTALRVTKFGKSDRM